MNFKKCILYGISNKKRLAELLNVEKYKLKNIRENYVPFKMEKNVNGKVRELFNADSEHKRILKRLVKFLKKIEIPNYIHGGIPGRSYVSNVALHIKNKYGIIVDISNFFPSTDDSNVFNFFYNDLKQSTDIAKILTNLTTVTNGSKSFLPQGFPTSPILSFLAYHKMYKQLNHFAELHGYSFSAYYDDLTFSSKKRIPKKHKDNIINIIESYNLSINKRKTKVRNLDYSKITGCVIRNNELKAPRKLQKETYDLYQKLHDKDYLPSELLSLVRSFQGKVMAIKMIEKDRKFPNYMKLIEEKKIELKSHKIYNNDK